MKPTTISINYPNCEEETIGIENGIEIIAKCIHSAMNNKTIYFFNGSNIVRKQPNNRFHEYVSYYRNGEFSWVSDYIYAYNFTFKTAQKHILKLYKEEK